MLRYVHVFLLLVVFPAIYVSCSRSDNARHQTGSGISDPKPTAQESVSTEDPGALCNRIEEIKILPQKGERGEDRVYDAFMKAGEKVLPCLIDKVSDTTKTPDPRQEPRYPDIEVTRGDIAYFLIVDIAKLNFTELLPTQVRTQYNSEGVHAYFKYVQEVNNRKALQQSLRAWYSKK